MKSGWTAFWQPRGIDCCWEVGGFWVLNCLVRKEVTDERQLMASPGTITERKCDGLSGFYQSWAEFAPASSMVHFSLSTLAGAFLAQQHHWPVQATASQPNLCLWLSSSLSHPKDALCKSHHIPLSVSDPKTKRWGAGEREYKSCCPELHCLSGITESLALDVWLTSYCISSKMLTCFWQWKIF